MATPSAPPSQPPIYQDIVNPPKTDTQYTQQPQQLQQPPPPPYPGASPYPAQAQAMPQQPPGTQWTGAAGSYAARQQQQQNLWGGSGGGQQQSPGTYNGSSDTEAPAWESNVSGFSEKSIRLAFIKKVFAILAVMLVVTGAVMCIFMFVEGIKDYASDHIWVYLTAIGVYIVAVIALVCAGDMRRKVPQNFIFLGIITLAMGVMLGCIAATYDADEVLMAVGITLLITLGMMALGFQNKIDFTYLTGIMCVLTFTLIGFGLMCAIFRSEVLYIFYACMGASLFSLWIVVDVQMMLGGKHKFSISPEEYIVAALNLYLDIVNVLLYVLMIIGMVKD